MERDKNMGKAVEGDRGQDGMETEERTRSAAAGNEKTKKKEREKRLKQRGREGKTLKQQETENAQRIMGQKVMTHNGVEGKERQKEI